MKKKVSLLHAWDHQPHFSTQDLPMLLHYQCKQGGSYYSMVLIEHLALQGHKVLLLTWYPQAKEQFLQDTPTLASQTILVDTREDIQTHQDKQLILLRHNDEQLCLQAIKQLKDIDDRIILIKNIELYHKPLITEALNHKKVILSGDLDASKYKKEILAHTYNAVILFSQPKTKIAYTFVPWAQYTGYLRSKKKEGYVAVGSSE